jgi:hypothetical protein
MVSEPWAFRETVKALDTFPDSGILFVNPVPWSWENEKIILINIMLNIPVFQYCVRNFLLDYILLNIVLFILTHWLKQVDINWKASAHLSNNAVY